MIGKFFLTFFQESSRGRAAADGLFAVDFHQANALLELNVPVFEDSRQFLAGTAEDFSRLLCQVVRVFVFVVSLGQLKHNVGGFDVTAGDLLKGEP